MSHYTESLQFVPCGGLPHGSTLPSPLKPSTALNTTFFIRLCRFPAKCQPSWSYFCALANDRLTDLINVACSQYWPPAPT